MVLSVSEFNETVLHEHAPKFVDEWTKAALREDDDDLQMLERALENLYSASPFSCQPMFKNRCLHLTNGPEHKPGDRAYDSLVVEQYTRARKACMELVNIQIMTFVRLEVMEKVRVAVIAGANERINYELKLATRAKMIGRADCWWLAGYDFLTAFGLHRPLARLMPLMDIALSTGWVQPLENGCIVYKRL